MPSKIFLPVDVHGNRPVTQWPENQISSGVLFTATHSVSVGTATAVTVLIDVPATDEYTVQAEIGASNTGTWTLSKAPNASGGTAITAANNSQGSATAFGATLTHTATYVSSGTVLENHSNAAGIEVYGGWWTLAASTLYLVRFSALNAGTTVNVNLRVVQRDT